MYSDFFGFSEKPFDGHLDPRFLYMNLGYRKNIASLIYGIYRRQGLISIIGELGAGKTTLLDAALNRLDKNTKIARIFNTDANFEQLLNMILVDLGLARAEGFLYKQQALDRLKRFCIEQLENGRNVALIVDEAQDLRKTALENLVLLSNLETKKHKLIQIVLSGKPELETRLCQPELKPLAQRINLRIYVKHLSEKDTYQYIQHRLKIANYQGEKLFGRRSLQLIWEYSGGVPRKINVICDNALLIGYGKGKKRIVSHMVEEAIEDLSWKPFSGTFEALPGIIIEEHPPQAETKSFRLLLVLAAGLGFFACFILLMWLFSGASGTNLQANEALAPLNRVRVQIISQPDFSYKYPGLVHPDPPIQPPVEQYVIIPDDNVFSSQAYVSESNTDVKNAGNHIIQLGAFRKKKTADGMMKRLREKGYEPYMEARNTKNKSLYYRVRLGGYTSNAEAGKARAQLARQGFRDSFIIRPNKS